MDLPRVIAWVLPVLQHALQPFLGRDQHAPTYAVNGVDGGGDWWMLVGHPCLQLGVPSSCQ